MDLAGSFHNNSHLGNYSGYRGGRGGYYSGNFTGNFQNSQASRGNFGQGHQNGPNEHLRWSTTAQTRLQRVPETWYSKTK